MRSPTTPVAPAAPGASNAGPGTPPDAPGHPRPAEPEVGAADELLARTGGRLAAARRERGLTLAVVAARSGISPAYVSQIESGAANPTVRALSQVAAAVGVPALLGVRDAPNPDFDPRPSLAALAHSVAGSPGVWDTSAAGSTRLVTRIVHGDAADHAAPTSHAGEEYVLVLHGRCRLHVGDASFVLGPGDACHFPAGRVHRLDEVSADLTLSVVLSTAP
ncbi:transcriptional regulator, XRE family with cupin sensor [Jatrophihabitans endophyticus]|uniref:Transcriptional regulator, XRE family with cupin sensor n=1 Tax=Jatrophihabitans endophyticus TaxID=1206085 RepID=A0A1M5P495_9ACTN|nr:XRE family transcriptional regulator [Jatrophihabitans endophyticus]SHG96641.1 transcriptional regulator, XRE family with cupin sensor [Jatrophihabitans endophyticus]